MFETTCLVETLNKCKQSSKEAVENLDSFSDFKQYIHVSRKVEEELEELILYANGSTTSQLILVCGGVGDGKSHLMSFFKNKFEFLRDSELFYLHNDATESFEPQQTSIQTLAETFWHFSDEGLKSGEVRKAILAINLGALNNFIDSDEAGDFIELRKYVIQKKILESHIEDNSFDPNSPFQFINFSDYHMFQLTEQGPKSDFIYQMIQKITAANDENPFYEAYTQHCQTKCPVAAQCPVKQNYELLSLESLQPKIINILIQAIIKEKLIISTRSLLNFIHDLLVPAQFDSLAGEQIKEALSAIQLREYLDQLLPILMFNKEDASPIHHAVRKLRLTQIRTEAIDQLYIEFKSRKDGAYLFRNYIQLHLLPHLDKQLNLHSPWQSSTPNKEEELCKQKLVELFLYLFYFFPKQEHQLFADPYYDQFMKYLYYWNTGQVSNLVNLYKNEVKTAIFKWDGEGSGDYMYVQIGQPQTRYHSRQRLDLAPSVEGIVKREEKELSKFLPTMLLNFKSKIPTNVTVDHAEVELDFTLYKLLVRIGRGYRPNKKDKLQFIKFDEFIRNIIQFGQKRQEVLFEENWAGRKLVYRLDYDPDFKQFKFVEL